jgi:hypothetical protein
MTADQLLESLGSALGLHDLCFDANGCARMGVRHAPAVNFERDPAGDIHLYSVLVPLPLDGRESFYHTLLQGNLFGTSTGGSALAVDTDFNQVSLCRTVLTEHTTPAGFFAQVEAFVNAADEWQTRLARLPAEAADVEKEMPELAGPARMDYFMRG